MAAPTDTHSIDSPGPSPSERVRLACMACRGRKIRCTGPETGVNSSCLRCIGLSKECVWATQRQPKRKRIAQDTVVRRESAISHTPTRSASPFPPMHTATNRQHISPWDAILASRWELLHHIRLYFSTVHYYGYLTFIHEPSFLQLLDREEAPPVLTTMMVISAIHHAGDCTPAIQSRASELYGQVSNSIRQYGFQQYGGVELMTVMLARAYEGSIGNFVTSWTLSGIAVRMMQFLSLHTYDTTYKDANFRRLNPLLKPEALRRLAWGIFYMDTMADAGQHGVHLVTEDSFHIQLPCEEATFLRGEQVKTINLNAMSISTGSEAGNNTSNIGISGHLIRTAAIRRNILHFNTSIQYSDNLSAKILEDLTRLETQLKARIADIPGDLAYTDNNTFAYSKRYPAFFLLHLLRHNCFLMLAEARLNVCARDATLVDFARSILPQRIRHALPVSRIIADITRLGVACGAAIGVQAYTSLEILLFDPPHLAKKDPTIDPKSSHFVQALRSLMECIRLQSRVDEGVRCLHIEACARLIHCGFDSILTPADWEKCRITAPIPGQDTQPEMFNFRTFPFHRRAAGRSGYAVLDSTWLSNLPSRAASPVPDPIDASAVIAHEMSSNSNADASNLMDHHLRAEFTPQVNSFVNPSNDHYSSVHFDYPSQEEIRDAYPVQSLQGGEDVEQTLPDDWLQWLDMMGTGNADLDPLSWLKE